MHARHDEAEPPARALCEAEDADDVLVGQGRLQGGLATQRRGEGGAGRAAQREHLSRECGMVAGGDAARLGEKRLTLTATFMNE